LNEVISVLGRRLGERQESHSFPKLLERLEDLVPDSQIEWVYPDVPVLYGHIMKMIKENEGRLNFHDALISLFMKEHGLKHIVSFDTDFDRVVEIRRICNDEQIGVDSHEA
jgi:predicted nucleic acid-binding protein